MAVSDVSICNLALQKLGASRIASLTENSTEGKACNACYTSMRDAELRAHPWSFAITRVILAPDATAPAFDYDYAFTKPTGCLRILPPNTRNLDWHYEGNKILTNDGDTLNLRYVAQITDPAAFDSLFVEALACKLAWHMAEELTQSNTKKAAAVQDYRLVISAARRANAFEQISDDPPVDDWVAAREVGTWNGGS
jgi:hypothetical protein